MEHTQVRMVFLCYVNGIPHGQLFVSSLSMFQDTASLETRVTTAFGELRDQCRLGGHKTHVRLLFIDFTPAFNPAPFFRSTGFKIILTLSKNLGRQILNFITDRSQTVRIIGVLFLYWLTTGLCSLTSAFDLFTSAVYL